MPAVALTCSKIAQVPQRRFVLTRRIVWFVEENGKPKAAPSFNHAWYVWDWKHDGAQTIAYGPRQGWQ